MLRRTSWRPPNPWGFWETVVLAGYLILIAVGIAWHEPWADEAQAWLMARDMHWTTLVLHGVRYEGSPALWQSILWVLVRLHVSFTGMRWVGGGFAASGVLVWLWCAPFPRLLRLLLPFTFFIAYQDAVVARSYVLFALLCFSVAACLRSQTSRPLLTALLLGLLANLSVHGFVVSLALGATALIAWRKRVPGLRINMAAALFLCMWGLAIFTSFPPKDINFPAGRNIEHSWNRLEGKKTSKINVQTALPGELAPVADTSMTHKQGAGSTRKFLRLLSLITFPLSTFRTLALAAFAVLVALASRRRGGGFGLLALLPYALMLLVFQSLYMAPRHAGTLFVTFIVTAWLAWPRSAKAEPLAVALSGLLFLVFVDQVTWTVRAIWLDVHGPYSASVMTSHFLKNHLVDHRVAGFYYHSVGVLPYFQHNIYENQPAHAYWLWSTSNHIDASAPSELKRRPDYAIVSGWNWGNDADITADWFTAKPETSTKIPMSDDLGIAAYFKAHGYHETHRFCGHTWMRNGYAELLCDVILEPVSPR